MLLVSCPKDLHPLIKKVPVVDRSIHIKKIDVIGSLFLSILSGHNRYTHLTALRGDTVNIKLLDMNKVISDDSAIRALKRMNEADAVA